jgi:recombination protein U
MEYLHGTNPVNQIRGRQNRANGALFENMIDASCKLYDLRGAAHIEKTPEPMKITQSFHNGYFKAVFTKQAQPDFKGTLAGGRSVVFDAKETDLDRIQQSAITPEQEKDLNKHEALGALCFILVSFNFQTFYRVPWDDWKKMRELFGHKYATEKELQEFRVKFISGNIMFLGGEK